MFYREFVLILSLSVPTACAADEMTVSEWLDLFIDSCVGSGSSFFVSGSVDAGVGLSLKKLKADGSIAGQVEITKSTYRLLSDGISNAMTEVSAGQADKVRECLAPVRQNLLLAMNQQIGTTTSFAQPTIHILSPDEESIMKTLAKQRGVNGETGKNIKTSLVMDMTNMSDIRFRATMRQLQSKGLAMVLPSAQIVGDGLNAKMERFDAVSLFDAGEEYVLNMGYVQ